MEELCTSCLCNGRKLHDIFDTKFHDLYIQIINEISPFYTSSQLCIKICWECLSMLTRFQSFKQQIWSSYMELLRHLRESSQPTPKQPRLTTHNLFTIHCRDIKPEPLQTDDNNTELINVAQEIDYTDYTIEFKNVKFEKSIEYESILHEESVKKSNSDLTEKMCVKANESEEDHCEETFVDEISAPKRRGKKVKRKQKKDKINETNEEDSDSENLPLKNYKKMYLETSLDCSNDKFMQYQLKTNNDENEIYLQNSLYETEDAKEIKSENYYGTNELLQPNDSEAMSNHSDKDVNIDVETNASEIKKKRKRLKINKPVKNKDFTVIDLSFEEMQAERQSDRQNKTFINAKYKCATCITWFYNKHSHDQHMKLKHDVSAGEFKCPVCETVVASFEAFTAHYNTHMRGYECSICKKRTASVKLMQRHYALVHQRIKDYKCKECDKICDSKDSFRYHVNSHSGRLPCSLCDKTFTHRAGLANHTQSVHKKKNQFPCSHCGKVFRWKPSLVRHSRRHHSHHTGPPIAEAHCGACDVHFASISSLQRHLKNSLKHVSQDDLRYVCDDCNRRYSDKTKLRNHIEEKHLHKTFYCPICNKPSKNAVGLDQHIRNVHKGRPNNKICHHCGKGFPTRTQLESHIRIHTGERPFICEFCPTTFSQHSNLYKHNRQVHLNIKTKRSVREERKRFTERNTSENLPTKYCNNVNL